MQNNRLTAKEMARFVASGYLKFEEMVPQDLAAACLDEIRNYNGYFAVGTPFDETWPPRHSIG